MSPVLTLHDFTLSLLRDPQALSAFQSDPKGVLSAAGLGDVTAADVHEVIPLVMDYAPASVVEKFDQAASADHLDQIAAAPMPSGPAGAIDQLHQLTEQFSFAGAAEPVLGALGGGGFGSALAHPLPAVDGAVGTATNALGLTPAVNSAAGGLNTAVDNVTAALDGSSLASMPTVGGIVRAASADLDNAVGGVTDNASHGTLVSSAVDATTNHLLDSALTNAVSDTLNQDAPAIGGVFSTATHSLSGPLASANSSLGSTPVIARSDGHLDLSAVSGQAGAVTGALHDLAPAGDVAHNLGDLPAAGGVTNTVTDHLGNVPAAGGVPNTVTDHLGNVPAAGGVTNTVTDHLTHPAAVLPRATHLTDTLHSTNFPPAVHNTVHDVTSDLHVGDNVHHAADDAHLNIGGDYAGLGHAIEPAVHDVPSAHEFHPGL